MISKKPAHSQRKRTDILSASEIGQFVYCSVAWDLQRRGFQPESPHLETGKQGHYHLGTTMQSIEKKSRHSRVLSILGYLFIACALLFFFFEVIL